MRVKLSNQLGFTLMETLVAASIMMIIGFGTISIMLNMQKEVKRANFISSLSDIQSNIRAGVSSTTAWAETVRQNPDMACLRNLTSCSAINEQWFSFSLYSQGGFLIYPGAIPTAGFTEDGATCNTWVNADSNDCPVRVNLRWMARCDTTGTDPACLAPAVHISGELLYTASENRKIRPVNLDRFRIVSQLQTNTDLTRQLCTNMGGTFDVLSMTCTLGQIAVALDTANRALAAAQQAQLPQPVPPPPPPQPTVIGYRKQTRLGAEAPLCPPSFLFSGTGHCSPIGYTCRTDAWDGVNFAYFALECSDEAPPIQGGDGAGEGAP